MKKRLLIGVIISDCCEVLYEDMLNGIISQAFRDDCNVAVLSANHNFKIDSPHKTTSKEIFKLILSHQFDGFVYHRESIFSENIKKMIDELLMSSKKPFMIPESGKQQDFQLGIESFCSIFHIVTGKACHNIQNENTDFQPLQNSYPSSMEQINQIYKSEIFNRDIMFALSNNSNLSDFVDCLDNFTYYIDKMNQLYICVTEKYVDSFNSNFLNELSFDMGDKIKIILLKSSVKREYPEKTSFSSDDIIPAYNEEHQYPVSYFITPLNFNYNFLGYSAVSFDKAPFSFNGLYKYFINCIDIALEQVRLRSIIEKNINNVYTDITTVEKENPQYKKLCILRSQLKKNPELSWNITSIAESLYLSKSYLQKIYKQYFGKSIIDEIISFRIDKAKDYLRKTNMTVTEIATQCGYSSYNYFARQFKASEGIVPTDFRKKLI